MTEFIQHIPTIGEVAKMAKGKSNLILVVVSTHLKDISQTEIFPNFWGENKKSLKPPPINVDGEENRNHPTTKVNHEPLKFPPRSNSK